MEWTQKIFKELRKTNRATAVMACGTGKTEVGFWVYEKINPKIVPINIVKSCFGFISLVTSSRIG